MMSNRTEADYAQTPPSLTRWNRAFALRERLSKFCENVVQKPVSHRGMLGGVVLMLALVFITGANRIERRTLEGFAEPYQTIEIAASEAGIVQEVRVELGQAVKKGDVLAVLDDEVLKASLEIAQLKAQSTAALDASKVEIELRQQKLAALTQLNRSGSGSREEYARAKADGNGRSEHP